MINSIYNPLSTDYKSIIGALKVGEKVKFNINIKAENCFFAIRKDYENTTQLLAMQKYEKGFFIEYIPKEEGLFFYFFKISDQKYIGINKNYEGEITSCPKPFQLTVYLTDFKTSDFIKGGIIYQIFPDRFCKGKENIKNNNRIIHKYWEEMPYYLPDNKGEILNNDFFGGNLEGIISKLDYLKSIYVSVIYLNPIFEAYSNHRYDTGDFFKIDSLLGNEETLKKLILEAEKRDIKIILDGVFNHTGADSIYFNKYEKYNEIGAYQSNKSKYYNWYTFNNYPDDYECWWGIRTLPAVNEKDSLYQDFICGENGVIAHYIKLGIYGWRLDVADELPSFFIEKIRERIKKLNKDAILIGEVWEDASNKISYNERRKYFLGKELDSVMNYPLKNAILNYCQKGDTTLLVDTIKTQLDHYPKEVLDSLMNILGTHDTIRAINCLIDKDISGMSKEDLAFYNFTEEELIKGRNRLKMACVLEYTLYGVPSVYYGDEVGLTGYFDPLNRKPYPWDNEDIEILDFYKKIGEIRNKIEAFKSGRLTIEYYDKDAIFYLRKSNKSSVFVAINNSKREYFMYFNGTVFELLSKKRYICKAKIEPYSYGIFYGEKL